MSNPALPRRTFLVGASLGITATLAVGCGLADRRSPRAPNIVWIMADDLGLGDLGAYGQQIVQTPSLDQMAQDGMRFTSAYTAYPVCRPARCSLMTGYHMGHAYIRENPMEYPLRPEDRTVAEVLQEAGYTTAIIGKWALGNEGTTGIPNRQGFDEFWGWLDQTAAHNYYPTELWHNEERVALPGNEAEARGTYAPDYLIQKALDFIETHQADPFFLYLPFTLPHPGHTGDDTVTELPIPSRGVYEDLDLPDPARSYAAMIRRIDAHVGKVLSTLDKLGLAEDTLVFFTSDNGPFTTAGYDPAYLGSNGPYSGGKNSLQEGGIRMPMIARWTGTVPAGQVSDFAWAFWDFLPTAAELAGVDAPPGLDGRSILPTLRGEQQAPHPYLYWEQNQVSQANSAITLRLQAVRSGDWKLLAPVDEPPQLYDLTADPTESNDLAADYPDRVADLQQIASDAHDAPVVDAAHLSG